MAQSGHAELPPPCLLSGVKRTPPNRAVAAANDPKRTSDQFRHPLIHIKASEGRLFKVDLVRGCERPRAAAMTEPK